MRKNETVELTVEEINNLGCGVGHLPDGMVMFVPGAVTGDTVVARVIKVNKTYLVGRLEEVKTASPYRTDGEICPAKGCGGCVYRHVKYEHETKLKRDYVINAFRKAGLPDVEVEEVRSTGITKGYRNKAEYPVFRGKNGMEAGFYAGGTHRVVAAEGCALQPPVFADIVRFLCEFADHHGITAYDETTGKGLLRHIYLRRGSATGECMVCLVINGKSLPAEKELVRTLTERFPEVVSVWINQNLANTNVVLGDSYRLIGGKEKITDRLCGLDFAIAPAAFYQVNHDACELLYGIAREKAGLTGGETVLDLYCGIGTIGLSMARNARDVIGIEIVEDAVKCATENAAQNGVANSRFFCGDASDAEKLLENAERERGEIKDAVVIMDPPRKGSTPELIRYLAKREYSKIVYVSCNPDTLARDCALFRKLGYSVGTATPVDLFPRTGHVETVVLMSRDKE